MINKDTNVLFLFLIRYYYFSQINLRILFSFLLFSFFCKYFVFLAIAQLFYRNFKKTMNIEIAPLLLQVQNILQLLKNILCIRLNFRQRHFFCYFFFFIFIFEISENFSKDTKQRNFELKFDINLLIIILVYLISYFLIL